MTVFEEFKKNLETMKPQFESMLKSDTDKFIQIAANYIEANPKLIECNRPSLFKAITDGAQCHLFFDGQEASIVPFKGTAKFMPGYKGLLKLVRNSGELETINANVVYEADAFEYFVDEKGEHIKHSPKFGKDRGKPIITYCIARTKGSDAPYVEVMTEEEVQACKKQSGAVKFGGDTPWNGDFSDEMRKKTVFRRIHKRLPSSTDLNTALSGEAELFDKPEITDAPPAPEKTTSSRLAGAVGAAAPAAPAPAETPTPAPDPAPAAPAPAQEKAEYVEGVIVETKIVQVTKDGKPTDRYACRVGEQWFGSFDKDIYASMNAAKDKKVNCWVIYQDKLNAQKKPYKECLDVKEMPVSEDEVLI